MGEAIQILTLADISGSKPYQGEVFRNRRHKTDPNLKVKAPPNLMSHCLVGRFKKIRINREEKSQSKELKNTSVMHVNKSRTVTAPAALQTMGDRNVNHYPEPGYTERMLDHVYIANVYGLHELTGEPQRSAAEQTGTSTDKKSTTEVESLFEAPLDFVMTTVKINRIQRLNNIAVGITPEVHTPAKKMKSKQKIRQGAFKHKVAKIKFYGNHRDRQGETPETKTPKSPTKDSDIRGWFPFPKERNFISQDSQRIDSAGVDWLIKNSDELIPSLKQEHTLNLNIPKQNNARKTIPGKLCTNKYPVTEALNKHGTSLTKQKGRILLPGDCNINKVWHRRLSNVYLLSPYQMAREDIISPLPTAPTITVEQYNDIPKATDKDISKGYTVI